MGRTMRWAGPILVLGAISIFSYAQDEAKKSRRCASGSTWTR